MDITRWQGIVYSLINIGWIAIESKGGVWLTKTHARHNRVMLDPRTLKLFVKNKVLEKKESNGDVTIYAKP